MSSIRRKRKARQQATAYRLPDAAPTPEQMDKGDFEQIEAPLKGREGNVRTYRRRCRATHWWAIGWLEMDERNALRKWDDLDARTGPKSPRCALDMSPRGFDDAGPSLRAIEAMREADRIGRELTARVGRANAGTVLEWMRDERMPAEIYRDTYGGRNADNIRQARSLVRLVGRTLVDVLRGY